MAGEDRSFGEHVASAVRYIIVGMIAVVLFGTSDDGRSAMNRAYASGGIAAAPGYHATTINGTGSRFYITDTNAKIICVYSLHGERLKLVSARRFDNDEKVFDGSIKAPIAIEGGSGVNFEDTEKYVRNAKPAVDDLMKLIGRPPTE